MEVFQIFNTSNPNQTVNMPCALSSSTMPQGMDKLDEELKLKKKALHSGTDYAKPYIKEEERQLLEYVNPLETNMDDVSQGVTPSVNDTNEADITRLYETYNFAHRPKGNLTITSIKDKIISMINTNSVVVIQGPTGCGKTTQVPQFILDSCYKKKQHCNIIVTQPRRIAAISIAKRVCQERDWPEGSLVGFQVGMINKTSVDTRLTYCTTGVLLHKLINAKHMLDYTHVILDEVHERDQVMDFLLLVVRKLLRTNSRSVKVVLMSATFNVNKFAKYFSSPISDKLVPAPMIDVSKKNYFLVNTFYLCQIGSLGPVPEVSLEEPTVSNAMMNFCRKMVIILDDIDKNGQDYDPDNEDCERHVALIFLPGIHEIEEMHSLLSSSKHENSKWDVVVLHSSITQEEQQRIFLKPPKGYRRVILSTNIAESSITVPDVKYVIDFCLTKQLVTDPATNFQYLELTWASKANCEQRAGRTGRVMDGRVFRLIPKAFYEELPSESSPEMLRAPLENLVLQAKMLDMGSPKATLALSLDPPDLSNLERTILILKEVGALDLIDEEAKRFDGTLTDLGRVMAQLPMDIHIAKLIVLGHVFSVLRETIIIGCSMAVRNMFSTPFQKKILAYNSKLCWSGDSCSDCLAFLSVYKSWQNEKAHGRLNSNQLEKKWAERNFVQIRVLREVDALVNDVTHRLKRMQITESVGLTKVVLNDIERAFVLKVVIAGAFYPNYFVKIPQAREENLTMRVLNGLDPNRTVYLQGWPMKHPGGLYSRKLQDIFQDCVHLSIEKIKVFFDSSSRVCIYFSDNETPENRSQNTQKIILPVYKAIKMRQSLIPIEIPIMKEEAALRRAEKLNIVQKPSEIFFSDKFDSEKVIPPPVTRPILPALDISYIPLKIHHVLDPGHFWAHVDDEETQSKLKTIESELGSEDALIEYPTYPSIGELVIAPYVESNKRMLYCRAVVESYDNSRNVLVKVLYIDYGWRGQVQASDLRKLETESEITKIPALAIECVLANIRPSVAHSFNGEWSKSANDMFMKLIRKPGHKHFGQIYSVYNSVVRLTLICIPRNSNDINTADKINVNEFLLEKQFAITKDEDRCSQNNHEIREKYSDMSPAQRRFYEERQYNVNDTYEYYPELPDVSECSTTVRLRGPFSPLEIELSHLTSAGRGKKVKIEQNSVNSVLLDNDPEDSNERLLVAGYISQGNDGRTLTLRNTTLMPNLQGLTSLIALIFAPRVELRRNAYGTSYIGALCGIGYDPRTKRSLFPEHDMEINFDVEITMDDLSLINRLRHWMSTGMILPVPGSNDKNPEDVLVCQNRLKSILFELMHTKRNPRNKEMMNHFNQWCLYDKSLFLAPGKLTINKNYIYHLHCALDLEDKNDDMDKYRDNLLQLRIWAAEDPKKMGFFDMRCDLCDIEISGIAQLRAHLYDEQHRTKEEENGLLF